MILIRKKEKNNLFGNTSPFPSTERRKSALENVSRTLDVNENEIVFKKNQC